MKTHIVLLCLAASAFAQTKTPAPTPDPIAAPKAESKPATDAPAVKAPVPHAMSDKQRGDFWFAQYKESQAELSIAKANVEALAKVMLESASKVREQAGQSIVKSCADAKIGPDGDIACPVDVSVKSADIVSAPKPEAPKPAK